MAMAIVWGLGFSTILTLLFVPALYMINLDIQAGLKRLFSGRRRKVEVPRSGRDEGRVSVELPISGAVPEVTGGGG